MFMSLNIVFPSSGTSLVPETLFRTPSATNILLNAHVLACCSLMGTFSVLVDFITSLVDSFSNLPCKLFRDGWKWSGYFLFWFGELILHFHFLPIKSLYEDQEWNFLSYASQLRHESMSWPRLFRSCNLMKREDAQSSSSSRFVIYCQVGSWGENFYIQITV